MSLSKRKTIILDLLLENPGMGKTAVMKSMFMLQQVKGIELGCDFSIYTYGPYAPDIMEDIDDLVSEDLLSSTIYKYNNYIGYKLDVTDNGNKVAIQLSHEEIIALKDISNFVHDKTAKQLELYSTIIYVNNLYTKNAWGNDELSIIQKVHEIKPHFSEAAIGNAYKELKEIKYLND